MTEFATKIKAELHVKNPSCYSKKRKRKPNMKICQEKDCGMEFVYSKDLRTHRLENHTILYTCPDCNIQLKTKFRFTRHVLKCRGAGKKFECNQCQYSSYQKTNLEKHVKSQHQVRIEL